VIADLKIKDSGLNGLLVNIAASLLSIPLIFVFYSFIIDKVSSKLNRTLSDQISYQINSIILGIFENLKVLLGVKQNLTWEIINEMIGYDKNTIKKRLVLDKKLIDPMIKEKDKLTDLMYKSANIAILSDNQIQYIATIGKMLSNISYELKLNEKSPYLVQNIQTLLTSIENWFATCEKEALLNHQHIRLL
jgi:phosphotransferase system  glucose/maltose/N-acetylglucosamine-specific IIC component